MPASMMDGQWWRLITAGFLHGDILHILMNSWVLFSIGAEVEQLFGTSRLIVFYFVSTVTGFYASSHFFGGHFSVGSSAGIFGLIGAMIAFGVTDKVACRIDGEIGYSAMADLGRDRQFLPGVDFMAHVGGFAGGFVCAFLASTPRARLMWKEPLLQSAGRRVRRDHRVRVCDAVPGRVRRLISYFSASVLSGSGRKIR